MIAVKVDLVGLLVSVILLGARYPHYVILAALVNFSGFCLGVFLLPGGIEGIVISGVFSTAQKSATASFAAKAAMLAAPPFANYAAARLAGPAKVKSAAFFLSPFVFLDRPFSVINLRFAAAFLLYNFILIYI